MAGAGLRRADGYQHTGDVLRQVQVAQALARLWGLVVFEQTEFAGHDFDFYRGEHLRYRVEVKWRHAEWWPYKISSNKWDGLVAMDSDRIPSLLAVRFPHSGLLVIRADRGDYERGEWGRTDRNDPLDVSEAVSLPYRAGWRRFPMSETP